AGTRHLQRHNRLLKTKEADLKKKYLTFQRHVLAFNTAFPGPNPIDYLTFDEVNVMPIDHPFWDFGRLTHPQEPWAVDPRVQDGIKAHLNVTHAEDELRRIARECRQLINWSGDTYQKMSHLRQIVYSEDESPDLEQNKWLMEILNLETRHGDDRLSESKKVFEALLNNLDQTHCRLWMEWNQGIQTVISGTLRYSELSAAEESALMTKWKGIVDNSRQLWERIVSAPLLRAEAEGIDEPVDIIQEQEGPEVGDPDEVYDVAYWALA
ncbi:hypothetical protein DFH28DRAFT_914048, partial [Melampsora americana]